jgi:hypothetical protein
MLASGIFIYGTRGNGEGKKIYQGDCDDELYADEVYQHAESWPFSSLDFGSQGSARGGQESIPSTSE